jgi:tetratricopeptide (TPR) repeat protein
VPWNNTGLVRQMLGQHAEAVADFDRALAVRPDYPEALTNRGRARLALRDWAGAQADLDQALTFAATTPFAAAVLHNRGLLRQERKALTGALADFDKALEIDPKHAATYVARGLIRKEVGDLQGALEDFDQALEQNPSQGLAAIYHGRGGVRVLLNDFAGALADYDRALSLDPEKFHLYISRGNARYHRRDRRAVLDFRMAFRLDAEGAAREVLRVIAVDAKRYPEAVLENCTKHIRINDRDAMAYGRRGLTLLLLGRDAEAETDLARFQELVLDGQPYLQRVAELAREYVSRTVAANSAAHRPASRGNLTDAVFAGHAL